MANPSFPSLPSGARMDTNPDFLEEAGFFLLDTFCGRPLEKEVDERCDRLAGKTRGSDMYKEAKLWVHPSGVIALVKAFAFSQGGPLMFNQASLVFMEDRPLSSQGWPLTGTFGISSGRRIATTQGNHTGAVGDLSDSFKMAWSNARVASEQGSLVPLERWLDYMRDPVLENNLSSLSAIMDSPVSLIRDWSKEQFLATDTTIPAQRYRLSKLALGSLKEKVIEAIGQRTAKYPDQLAQVLTLLLEDEVKNEITSGYGFGSKIPTPAHKRNYAMAQFSNAFVNMASSVPSMPVRLSQSQQDVCAQWIQALSDPRSAARTTWKSLPSHLPGVPGLAAHDLLLTHTEFPGVWEKLESQVRAASNEQLLSWIRGQEGNSPLALSIARVVLDIPNRSSRDGEQRRVLPRALGVLDYLASRLGVDALVWESTEFNLWGHALGKDLNLPIDQDLVEIHGTRLRGFLDWAQARHVKLPSIVRWSSFRDPGIKGLEFMPYDLGTFRQQWLDHGPEIRSMDAALHWALLEPLSSLVRRSALKGVVEHPRAPDSPRRNPRL